MTYLTEERAQTTQAAAMHETVTHAVEGAGKCLKSTATCFAFASPFYLASGEDLGGVLCSSGGRCQL